MALAIGNVAKTPAKEQQKVINRYLGEGLAREVNRFFLSMLDRGVRQHSTPELLKGAAVGGGIMLSLAAIVNYVYPVTNIYWLFGGAAASGAVGGAVYKACTIAQSDVFRRWVGEAIKKEVFPLFLDFIQDDEEMRDFICTFTQEYPTVPAVLPDGKVYEKEQITEWVREHGSSPFRIGGPYTVDSITYHPSNFFVIVEKMKAIRERVLRQMPADQIIQQGLAALCMDLFDDFAIVRNREIHNKLRNGEITLAQARAALHEITEISLRIDDPNYLPPQPQPAPVPLLQVNLPAPQPVLLPAPQLNPGAPQPAPVPLPQVNLPASQPNQHLAPSQNALINQRDRLTDEKASSLTARSSVQNQKSFASKLCGSLVTREKPLSPLFSKSLRCGSSERSQARESLQNGLMLGLFNQSKVRLYISNINGLGFFTVKILDPKTFQKKWKSWEFSYSLFN